MYNNRLQGLSTMDKVRDAELVKINISACGVYLSKGL